MLLPKRSVHLLSILLFSILVVASSACNGASPTSGPDVQITLGPAEVDTPAPPTALPSPTASAEKVWLIVPPGADAALGEAVNAKLVQLAAQSHYLFEQIESIDEKELAGVRIVVSLGDNPAVGSLITNTPQTHFILIGSSGVEPSSNVSIIEFSPANESFIAGLIATIIAPDRRAGGLFAADDPDLTQQQESFANGGAYLCGRCVPVYAPVVLFPVTNSVSPNLGIEGWKAGFDLLDQNRIEVLFLPPEAVSADMLDYMKGQSVVVVGSVPPPDGYTSLWAASVNQDAAAALAELWPEIIVEGASGQKLTAQIVISSVNELLLTPGKLQVVEKVAADLQAGWISPLSVP